MTSTSTPVISAARSGGYDAARSRSSSQPTVLAASHASSASPSRKRMCIRPSASAVSVAGRRRIYSSADRAVSVLRGSMTTTCAPRRCASRKNGKKCGPVLAGLCPHKMINLLVTASAYGAAHRAPSVTVTAFSAAAPQIERSSPLAPIRFHNRWLTTRFCSRPSVPLYEYGKIAAPPSCARMRRQCPAISPIASSHEIRRQSSGAELPLGPTRRMGYSSRSGA